MHMHLSVGWVHAGHLVIRRVLYNEMRILDGCVKTRQSCNILIMHIIETYNVVALLLLLLLLTAVDANELQ